MRKSLDNGKKLGMPDGVLINGKGPYRYNSTLVPDGIAYETVNVDPGTFIYKYLEISHFNLDLQLNGIILFLIVRLFLIHL